MRTRIIIATSIIALSLLIMYSCQSENKSEMDQVAEGYVKLVLEIGLYDADYVDAYYGPQDWKPSEETKEDTFPKEKLISKVNALIEKINSIETIGLNKIEQQRKIVLTKQLISARAIIEMISGEKYTFDEESFFLYDAVAPTHGKEYFDEILERLEDGLPGKGNLTERYNNFIKDFIVPKENLDAVFKAALKECRSRTLKHIKLPENENFKIEYVTDKVWGGYNWYKGNSFSLIQINTDLPIYINRAVDLAAHEAYPGHHVFNALLENELYKKRGWVEYTVYPLFSPQSLIAEGSANYAKDLVLPWDFRLKFEREVLFPLAGLDTSRVKEYYEVMGYMKILNYAGNEAARNYLDGKISSAEAQQWLEKYSLNTADRAKKRIGFFKKYRSYVINYNLGKDIVGDYIEANSDGSVEKEWQLFTEILSTPYTASMLKVAE